MHTAGLVEFLGRDGYDVRHFCARYPAWGIGRVDGDGYLRGVERENVGRAETFGRTDGGVGDPRRTGEHAGGVGDPRRTLASEAIEFTDSEWNLQTIRKRFRWPADEEDSEPQRGRHRIARDENPGMVNDGDSEPQRGRHRIARDENPGMVNGGGRIGARKS